MIVRKHNRHFHVGSEENILWIDKVFAPRKKIDSSPKVSIKQVSGFLIITPNTATSYSISATSSAALIGFVWIRDKLGDRPIEF